MSAANPAHCRQKAADCYTWTAVASFPALDMAPRVSFGSGAVERDPGTCVTGSLSGRKAEYIVANEMIQVEEKNQLQWHF